MYIMYVDESGDPGNNIGSSQHYILSGLIIEQSDWKHSLKLFKDFRSYLKDRYGLNVRTELHARELIRIEKIKEYRKIKKYDRVNILKECSKIFLLIFYASKVINICFDKSKFHHVEKFNLLAWKRLITRYDKYLKISNGEGIIIADEGNNKSIRELLRKSRIYNPTPSLFADSTYNPVIENIIEHPFHKASNSSYFIQAVDIISYLLFIQEFTKGSLKKYNLDKSFKNIELILLLEAARKDPQGIVRT